jgi:hypothetical protein
MPTVSSPLSTGHAGPSYEQHLGAACLAVLLSGGMTPLYADSTLTQIHFQARHLGWATDDLLLVGETGEGPDISWRSKPSAPSCWQKAMRSA